MNSKFTVTLSLAVTLLFACSQALKEGQSCVASGNCDSGLHCETCLANGNVRPRCTRTQPVNPLSKVKGLPFNRYSWLTTHNSFAKLKSKSGTGGVILAPMNQQDTITEQLNVSLHLRDLFLQHFKIIGITMGLVLYPVMPKPSAKKQRRMSNWIQTKGC